MSNQQDIYATGFENRPPMLNKDNYVPWSSRLLRYAKIKPNGKLLVNSIKNGQYVLALEKKAKLFNEWERFTYTKIESTESYYHRFSKLMNDFSRNKHFPEKIANNLKFLNNLQPEWKRSVTTVHQTKDLHEVDYIQLYDFSNNQAENVENQVIQNVVQNSGVQNVENQNGLIVVLGIANPNANQIRNGNVVAARAKGNGNGNNGDLERLGSHMANCIIDGELQASTDIEYSTDSAHVYESDGDSKKQSGKGGGTVDLHPATAKEKRIIYMILLYNNLAIEVEKVNTVK
ncbi:hypothetical protein Tco_1539411 [Tanacetum coccineum]